MSEPQVKGLTLALASSAVISPDGQYRYLLTRQVGPSPKVVTFIMLNPSTAEAEQDDPTIRRCIGFTRLWGYGQLRVVNLFAFRTSKPAGLRTAADPIGPENGEYLSQAVQKARVVCAWGVDGRYLDQDLVMLRRLAQLEVQPFALEVTKGGHPKHPLYVSFSRNPLSFAHRGQG